MADYNPENGFSLLTGATDADGDPMVVYSVNGSVPGAWPVVVNLTQGTATVAQSGDVFVTLASNDDSPADTVTKAFGSFTYQLTDGEDPSNTATCSIDVTGTSGGGAPAYVATGLVERWAADAGITLSGSDVTDWLGQVAGLNLDAISTPTIGTAPGGTAGDVVVLNGDDGFTGTTLTGMPSGSGSRTVQMIWKPTGAAFNGGFGWGSAVTAQAFTLAANDSGEMTVDTYNGSVSSGLTPTSQWTTMSATYDGTTIKFWIGDVLIASQAAALTTGASIINVCKSFSGYPTNGEIGEILVYGRVLSDAEIAANVAYLNDRFIGSSTVSNPGTPTGSTIAETTFNANVTASASYGFVAWSARASATPATEAEILAGTGAIDFGIAVVNGTAAIVIPVTGGTASTAYYVNAIQYGLTGGKSSVVTSAAITTTAAPGANPVLSAASLTATGTTTASGSVSTDTGNGALKYGLMLSTATTPNITQLEAGTDGDGAPLIGGLRTAAVTASGAQAVSFTGLTASTAYKVAYGQRDASALASNIVTATDTTDAAATTSLTPDSTGATAAAVDAILASWEADWNGTTPAGKTNADVRVVQLTAPIATWTISGYDFSAYPGVIVRGVGPYGDNPTYPYYPTCGSHVSGTITISSCNNLQVRLITCQKAVMVNSPSCAFIDVSAHSRWSTTRSQPSAGIMFDIATSPGGRVEGVHSGGSSTCAISIGAGCDGFASEEFYCEQFADDVIKPRQGSATLNNLIIRRGWAGRDNLSGLGAHSDWMQAQSGLTDTFTFYGNIVIEGSALNGIAFQGGFFSSTTNSSPNAYVSQNILCHRGANAVATNGGTNDTSEYNTLLYPEWGANGSLQPSGYPVPLITGGWTTNQYNFACRLNTGSTDTSGTGGIVFTIGNTFSSSIVADTSGYVPFFDGFPGEETYIDAIKPKVGSVAHWDTVGQKVGAYERSREIWVDGWHPGNRGWPTAGRFMAEYDPSNTLGASWTGTYDDDGLNVTPSPTTITITEQPIIFYDSDPHGVNYAAITISGTHNQDGSTLQYRLVDSAALTTIQDWTDFTAGSGGVWSVVAQVSRRWGGILAEVRAKFSTGVSDIQATKWFSGYIVGMIGQSLATRPLILSPSTAALTPPDDTLWVLYNNVNGSTSAGPVEVTGSSVLSLRRMATTVGEYSDAPMMIVDMSEVGTGLGETVNANETTDRSWVNTVQAPVDYVQSRGTDLSVAIWHWFTNDASVQTEWERWVSPAMVKQAYNSLNDTADASGLVAYTGGSVNVVTGRNYTPVHYFWDMNGTGQGLFDETRTRLVPWYGASFANPQGVSGTYAANDIQKGRLAQAQANAATGVAVGQVTLDSVAAWTGQAGFGGHLAQPEGTHVSEDTGEEDGEALVAVYMAIVACRAVGALLPQEPQITAVTDAGTYWDVTVDLPHGGNLSTPLIEHTAGNYAGSFEATNWQTPTAVDEVDIAELHEVQGFAVWTGSSANWTAFTATITNTGTGTAPSRTGTIRVTPTGGTAGKTLSFGYADGFNLTSVANLKAARVYTHMPIETRTHVSGTGYGWPVIRQPGNTAIVVP